MRNLQDLKISADSADSEDLLCTANQLDWQKNDKILYYDKSLCYSFSKFKIVLDL